MFNGNTHFNNESSNCSGQDLDYGKFLVSHWLQNNYSFSEAETNLELNWKWLNMKLNKIVCVMLLLSEGKKIIHYYFKIKKYMHQISVSCKNLEIVEGK